MQHRDIKEMEMLARFLKRERDKVPSFSEFRTRLRNYGYCIRREEGGHFLHALPSRRRICSMPMEVFG